MQEKNVSRFTGFHFEANDSFSYFDIKSLDDVKRLEKEYKLTSNIVREFYSYYLYKVGNDEDIYLKTAESMISAKKQKEINEGINSILNANSLENLTEAQTKALNSAKNAVMLGNILNVKLNSSKAAEIAEDNSEMNINLKRIDNNYTKRYDRALGNTTNDLKIGDDSLIKSINLNDQENKKKFGERSTSSLIYGDGDRTKSEFGKKIISENKNIIESNNRDDGQLQEITNKILTGFNDSVSVDKQLKSDSLELMKNISARAKRIFYNDALSSRIVLETETSDNFVYKDQVGNYYGVVYGGKDGGGKRFDNKFNYLKSEVNMELIDGINSNDKNTFEKLKKMAVLKEEEAKKTAGESAKRRAYEEAEKLYDSCYKFRQLCECEVIHKHTIESAKKIQNKLRNEGKDDIFSESEKKRITDSYGRDYSTYFFDRSKGAQYKAYKGEKIFEGKKQVKLIDFTNREKIDQLINNDLPEIESVLKFQKNNLSAAINNTKENGDKSKIFEASYVAIGDNFGEDGMPATINGIKQYSNIFKSITSKRNILIAPESKKGVLTQNMNGFVERNNSQKKRKTIRNRRQQQAEAARKQQLQSELGKRLANLKVNNLQEELEKVQREKDEAQQDLNRYEEILVECDKTEKESNEQLNDIKRQITDIQTEVEESQNQQDIPENDNDLQEKKDKLSKLEEQATELVNKLNENKKRAEETAEQMEGVIEKAKDTLTKTKELEGRIKQAETDAKTITTNAQENGVTVPNLQDTLDLLNELSTKTNQVDEDLNGDSVSFSNSGIIRGLEQTQGKLRGIKGADFEMAELENTVETVDNSIKKRRNQRQQQAEAEAKERGEAVKKANEWRLRVQNLQEELEKVQQEKEKAQQNLDRYEEILVECDKTERKGNKQLNDIKQQIETIRNEVEESQNQQDIPEDDDDLREKKDELSKLKKQAEELVNRLNENKKRAEETAEQMEGIIKKAKNTLTETEGLEEEIQNAIDEELPAVIRSVESQGDILKNVEETEQTLNELSTKASQVDQKLGGDLKDNGIIEGLEQTQGKLRGIKGANFEMEEFETVSNSIDKEEEERRRKRRNRQIPEVVVKTVDVTPTKANPPTKTNPVIGEGYPGGPTGRKSPEERSETENVKTPTEIKGIPNGGPNNTDEPSDDDGPNDNPDNVGNSIKGLNNDDGSNDNPNNVGNSIKGLNDDGPNDDESNDKSNRVGSSLLGNETIDNNIDNENGNEDNNNGNNSETGGGIKSHLENMASLYAHLAELNNKEDTAKAALIIANINKENKEVTKLVEVELEREGSGIQLINELYDGYKINEENITKLSNTLEEQNFIKNQEGMLESGVASTQSNIKSIITAINDDIARPRGGEIFAEKHKDQNQEIDYERSIRENAEKSHIHMFEISQLKDNDLITALDDGDDKFKIKLDKISQEIINLGTNQQGDQIQSDEIGNVANNIEYNERIFQNKGNFNDAGNNLDPRRTSNSYRQSTERLNLFMRYRRFDVQSTDPNGPATVTFQVYDSSQALGSSQALEFESRDGPFDTLKFASGSGRYGGNLRALIEITEHNHQNSGQQHSNIVPIDDRFRIPGGGNNSREALAETIVGNTAATAGDYRGSFTPETVELLGQHINDLELGLAILEASRARQEELGIGEEQARINYEENRRIFLESRQRRNEYIRANNLQNAYNTDMPGQNQQQEQEEEIEVPQTETPPLQPDNEDNNKGKKTEMGEVQEISSDDEVNFFKTPPPSTPNLDKKKKKNKKGKGIGD